MSTSTLSIDAFTRPDRVCAREIADVLESWAISISTVTHSLRTQQTHCQTGFLVEHAFRYSISVNAKDIVPAVWHFEWSARLLLQTKPVYTRLKRGTAREPRRVPNLYAGLLEFG